jgi:hypothetical protein
MSYKNDHPSETEDKSYIDTENDEQTMLDICESDEDDKDQNEDELEMIRPKIELDVTQV